MIMKGHIDNKVLFIIILRIHKMFRKEGPKLLKSLQEQIVNKSLKFTLFYIM